nr:hypothetical protein [Granulicella rosea]
MQVAEVMEVACNEVIDARKESGRQNRAIFFDEYDAAWDGINGAIADGGSLPEQFIQSRAVVGGFYVVRDLPQYKWGDHRCDAGKLPEFEEVGIR